ncbi:sarcosine oxidase subunit gamma [Rhodobacter sp. NTK016B]|uniref:sarcosine oxidase subunit gamma n=1 Tax=Rhodobacter sp. NTK016B TaxID=2759676 RepID=UPI0032E44BD5
MVNLTPTAAFTGLPLTIGRATLTAFDPGPVTAIAPYPGRDLSRALAPLSFPAPGCVVDGPGARLVWTGREQAFWMGSAAPDLTGLAATTDQSDGWAWLTVSGPDAVSVLARLCPLDLRAQSFAVGSAARSMLAHMQAIMIRTGEDSFELGVFRSMAESLLHDLTGAMRGLAARDAL